MVLPIGSMVLVYMLTFGVYYGILMVNVTIYIAYMDPLGYGEAFSQASRNFQLSG